jgi:hypothetical protein
MEEGHRFLVMELLEGETLEREGQDRWFGFRRPRRQSGVHDFCFCRTSAILGMITAVSREADTYGRPSSQREISVPKAGVIATMSPSPRSHIPYNLASS